MPLAILLVALVGAIDPAIDDAQAAGVDGDVGLPAVVILPTVALGVDPAAAAAASDALERGLAPRVRAPVRGSTLPAAEVEALHACDGDACGPLLARLGVGAVVVSSLAPLRDDVVLTIRVKRASGTSRVQRSGALTGLEALVQQAAIAAPLEAALSPAMVTTSPPKPTTTPATPATTTAPPMDPMGMVVVFAALGFIPVIGSPLVLPFTQALVAEHFGPELVGLEYKAWGNAVVVGYLTYLLGFAGGIGLMVTGVSMTASDQPLGPVLMAGSGLVLVATVVAEPILFHLVSSSTATPASASR